MIDLKKVSGLNLKFNKKTNRLISKTIKLPQPEIRKLKDMKKVFYSPVKGNEELYYMYRGIVKKAKLRYDITIIPPKKIGKEYVKTKGHYHPTASNTNLTYPEIYEVLSGKVWYILQKKEKGKIVDVCAINAKKGDKVLIPPNYGHVTINASKDVLIMANLVSTKFDSEYKEIEKKKGAAYYGLVHGKKIRFVKNKNYKKLPNLKLKKVKDYSEIKIYKTKPLYNLFIEDPKIFNFLNKPKGVSNDNYKL